MCDICPVSSNTITDVDMVWVTLPDKAAAPVEVEKEKNCITSLMLTYKWKWRPYVE